MMEIIDEIKNVKCEVKEVDFAVNTITIWVPDGILDFGVHAGHVSVDFTDVMLHLQEFEERNGCDDE